MRSGLFNWVLLFFLVCFVVGFGFFWHEFNVKGVSCLSNPFVYGAREFVVNSSCSCYVDGVSFDNVRFSFDSDGVSFDSDGVVVDGGLVDSFEKFNFGGFVLE